MTSPEPLDDTVSPLLNQTPFGTLSTYSAPADKLLALYTVSGDVALSAMVNVNAPAVGFWITSCTMQQSLVERSVALVGMASHVPRFAMFDGRARGEFVMVSV